MIIPVRCFTCGKVIGNKWETYLSLLQADFSEGYVQYYRRLLFCVLVVSRKSCRFCCLAFGCVLGCLCGRSSSLLLLLLLNDDGGDDDDAPRGCSSYLHCLLDSYSSYRTPCPIFDSRCSLILTKKIRRFFAVLVPQREKPRNKHTNK